MVLLGGHDGSSDDGGASSALASVSSHLTPPLLDWRLGVLDAWGPSRHAPKRSEATARADARHAGAPSPVPAPLAPYGTRMTPEVLTRPRSAAGTRTPPCRTWVHRTCDIRSWESSESYVSPPRLHPAQGLVIMQMGRSFGRIPVPANSEAGCVLTQVELGGDASPGPVCHSDHDRTSESPDGRRPGANLVARAERMAGFEPRGGAFRGSSSRSPGREVSFAIREMPAIADERPSRDFMRSG